MFYLPPTIYLGKTNNCFPTNPHIPQQGCDLCVFACLCWITANTALQYPTGPGAHASYGWVTQLLRKIRLLTYMAHFSWEPIGTRWKSYVIPFCYLQLATIKLLQELSVVPSKACSCFLISCSFSVAWPAKRKPRLLFIHWLCRDIHRFPAVQGKRHCLHSPGTAGNYSRGPCHTSHVDNWVFWAFLFLKTIE